MALMQRKEGVVTGEDAESKKTRGAHQLESNRQVKTQKQSN